MISGLRARPAVLVVCAALAGLPAFGGCSFIFVQPPKNDDGLVRAGDCSTNVAAPAIDTVFVGTNVISAVYVAGQDNVTNKGAAIGAGIAVAGLWLSSAIYGYYYTSECKSLRESEAQGPWRPARIRRTVLKGPPAPRPPAPAPGEQPPVAPAGNTEPAAPPAANQQSDDDDPEEKPQPSNGAKQ